ncbi:TonB-dependent receptor [candidate division KSB1 bacterium]|nr:TonB-dependent receptor [candidate division KSB1 bacterium]
MINKKLMYIIILTTSVAFAGTTGKIAGRVIDEATGDPLPSVNVVVDGTMLGAATDSQGYYTILHVPPGTYNLRASFIGYSRTTINDVRVLIDQTARVDFKLKMETISGEEITVVADKNLVREDVATSVTSFTNEQVDVLPLVSVAQVVELQAGVEEGMVIRGGGADESLFQIDGVTLRDPRTNMPITGIALSAIKEISIERGGFNAEYGQVRSGIVNVVTKEGGTKGYSGTVTVKLSPPAAKQFGISPFDPNSMWMRPFLDPDVCWTGTQNGEWDYYTQRQYPQFEGWNAISEDLMTNNDPGDDLSPTGAQKVWTFQHRRRPKTDQPDYNIDAGFGGPVPFIGKYLGNLRFYTSYRHQREMLLIPLSRDDYVDYDWSLQLTSDINQSIKLKLSSLIGNTENVAINATDNQFYSTEFGINGHNYWNPTDYMRTPLQIASVTNEQRPGRIFSDSWYCPATVGHKSFAVKMTHILSPKTFYEAGIEYIARDYFTQPITARDESPIYEIVPGYFVDEAPFGWSSKVLTGLDGMFFGGHTGTVRDYSKISATTLKFDLSSQVNFNNLVKTGFEFVYNDLNLDYGEVNNFTNSRNYVQMRKFPFRGAFYVQDKMEAMGFIVNLGLRLDYVNSNTSWVNLSPFDKSYFSAKYNPTSDYTAQDAEPKLSVSPRLGISHPITENSKLFFNYGHFKQLPTYDEIFRLSRGSSNQINNIGDPNLGMASTVSYELGYDHVLYNNYLVQLAAFYHDITDQFAYASYVSADASINYDLATNNSYEDIRGFELTLRRSSGNWWTGYANYTYQVNTAGHFGTAEVYQDPSLQRKYERETKNMYQERPIPAPYARAGLTFLSPKTFGPQLVGCHPFEQWSLTMQADWRAGEWITWNPLGFREIAQNVQVKDWYNMTLRLNKTFSINKIKLSFFVEVNNLLNTKRLSGAGFYDSNDQIDYFESLHLPESRAYNNIVGDDRVGEYRKEGVAYQPIKRQGTVADLADPELSVIYYELTSKRYMEFTNGQWQQVPGGKMDQILKDKAYIDMPNMTSFNFLNPRQVFFGIRTSFDLD